MKKMVLFQKQKSLSEQHIKIYKNTVAKLQEKSRSSMRIILLQEKKNTFYQNKIVKLW